MNVGDAGDVDRGEQRTLSTPPRRFWAVRRGRQPPVGGVERNASPEPDRRFIAVGCRNRSTRVTFPEAQLVKIRGGLSKGLAPTAGVATVSADQLLKEEDDDQNLP